MYPLTRFPNPLFSKSHLSLSNIIIDPSQKPVQVQGWMSAAYFIAESRAMPLLNCILATWIMWICRIARKALLHSKASLPQLVPAAAAAAISNLCYCLMKNGKRLSAEACLCSLRYGPGWCIEDQDSDSGFWPSILWNSPRHLPKILILLHWPASELCSPGLIGLEVFAYSAQWELMIVQKSECSETCLF